MGNFRHYLLPLLTLCFFIGVSEAQVYENIYRPTRPDWKQIKTPHFRIIYQDGEQAAAIRSAHILENQYSIVQSLVGGSLSNMPVVLNGHNDLSNGYASTLNFRIEVEIPRSLGKTLNPRDGNWLNSVMPHELVHALHLNEIPALGVGGITRIFSPDAARSLHFAAPTGVHEGIAVFHDSHVNYGVSGRGNHPYFTQQFQAAFNSRNRWSVNQMLMSPSHTYPFDRHYIGGHEFIHWLQYEYGMDITKQTIRFVSRWPFMGYGTALWYTTGQRPSQLYKSFESDSEDSGEKHSGMSEYNPIYDDALDIKAMRIRRPHWITDNIILFYASSYSIRPGLYYYDLTNKASGLFSETRIVEDHLVNSHPDEPRFLYSRYHRHPIHHNHQQMQIHEVTFNDEMGSPVSGNKKSRRISGTDRMHAPVYTQDNKIWALQTHHESNILVQIDNGIADTLLIPDNGNLVEMAFHPHEKDSLVILANRGGLQGLWFLHRDDLDELNREPPDIGFKNASIYDPHWHPDGERLLFTSDVYGTMNLYEYHKVKKEVHQLTNHLYGIMEARYNPNGNTIAAIQFNENRFELVVLDRAEIATDSEKSPVLIPDSEWSDSAFSGVSAHIEEGEDAISDNWSEESYRTGIRWIRPRSIFPYWENKSEFIDHRFGLMISSGDVLRRNSYLANLSVSNHRFWYDLEYQFSGFYPGFRLKGYHSPIQSTSALWERKGAGIDIPLHYTMDKNTRTSAISIIPGLDYQQQRVISTDGDPLSQWISRTTTNLFIAYQHRLQQNIRDVQPNTGWLLFAETEWDIDGNYFDDNMRALRGGVYRYFSPHLGSNQSMRLGIESMTQNLPYFNISGFYSRGFDENVLAGVNNAARFNTRYTIPLWHIDRGQLLIPVFLDRIYGVLFSDTIVPLQTKDSSELYHSSRTLFGAGLRFKLRLFNIPVDIGAAFGFEPTRENSTFFIGPF